MRVSIIGCGQTAALWDGKGASIGVNDCWKFGNTTDALVVVDSFTRQLDRQKLIAECMPNAGFYSNLNRWKHHPQYKQLVFTAYTSGDVRINRVYHSTTSPFIAMSLAATQGFKEIVLYGVDLVDHTYIRGYLLLSEVKKFDGYTKALEKHGVKVYLASEFGALKEILPVWE